jgi:hypothetical protein
LARTGHDLIPGDGVDAKEYVAWPELGARRRGDENVQQLTAGGVEIEANKGYLEESGIGECQKEGEYEPWYKTFEG